MPDVAFVPSGHASKAHTLDGAQEASEVSKHARKRIIPTFLVRQRVPKTYKKACIKIGRHGDSHMKVASRKNAETAKATATGARHHAKDCIHRMQAKIFSIKVAQAQDKLCLRTSLPRDLRA